MPPRCAVDLRRIYARWEVDVGHVSKTVSKIRKRVNVLGVVKWGVTCDIARWSVDVLVQDTNSVLRDPLSHAVRGVSAWLCGCTYLDNCDHRLGQARWQNPHAKKRVRGRCTVHTSWTLVNVHTNNFPRLPLVLGELLTTKQTSCGSSCCDSCSCLFWNGHIHSNRSLTLHPVTQISSPTRHCSVDTELICWVNSAHH